MYRVGGLNGPDGVQRMKPDMLCYMMGAHLSFFLCLSFNLTNILLVLFLFFLKDITAPASINKAGV
jgi:hypothetical protein